MNTNSEAVYFRLTLAEKKKLEHLARQTRRSISGVLRVLIVLAEPASLLDVQLGSRKDNNNGN